METPEVPGGAIDLIRTTWGRWVSRVIGLPRRAGRRLHAGTDAEACWWRWEVAERLAGLGRQYRDQRFTALPALAAVRGDDLAAGMTGGQQGTR